MNRERSRSAGVEGPAIVLALIVVMAVGYGAVWLAGALVGRPVKGVATALSVGRDFWWLALILLALVLGGVSALLVFVRRRTADRRERAAFRAKRGMGRTSDVQRVGGRRAVLKRAGALRPSLPSPKIGDVGYLEGHHNGKAVWSTVEDSTLLLGPPRSGKGYFVVINRILDAVGAVVTTSTRPDNLVVAMEARKSGGRPVVVFDPEGLAPGVEGGAKWSPVRGCEDARTAAVRARGFAAVGFPAEGENQIWQTIAASILRCLLHAAALENRGARELYEWSLSPAGARDAVDILNSHPGAVPGWGAELEAVLEQDERTRESSWLGVRQSLSGLGDPRVLEAVSPGPGEGLDPVRLIRERGALFMVGTAQGAVTSAGLITALIEDIVQEAKQIAAASPGSRVDPPVTLVLDEAANYPLPSLGQVMSEGGGSGIAAVAVLQSLAQARHKWGADMAQAIWDSATVKMVLGGSANRETLQDISSLVGERDEVTTSTTRQSPLALSPSSTQDSMRRMPILTPDEVRQLPFGMALMMLRSAPPAMIDLRPWTKRKDAQVLKESQGKLAQQIERAHSNAPTLN
ncbi:MAG TPA: TraM recognition domain-containing protein [Beutenbergiaceae bacterium]|nr:TraM recognition domain-containing protein [Beutenbergiaceae bacterium]